MSYCCPGSVYYLSPTGLLYRFKLRVARRRKLKLKAMRRSRSVYRRLGLRYYA